MSIVPALPNTLQNGQPADANQVMANFTTIRDGVNSNAAANGANSDITSLSALSTPLSIGQGGTGVNDGSTLVPAGVVLPFAGSTAPSGFLLCDGQAVSRSTYATLYAALGGASSPWGQGDGSTTFNVPDMRGNLPMGLDNMGGSAANRVTSAVSGVNSTALGGTGGDQRTQAHSHGVTDPGHSHGVTDPGHTHSTSPYGLWTNQGGSSVGTSTAQANSAAISGVNSSTSGISVQSAGVGITIQTAESGGSQNMPPVVALNYIIKT